MIKGFRLQLFEQAEVVIYHKSKNSAACVKSNVAFIRIISGSSLNTLLAIFVYITVECNPGGTL